VQKLEETKVVEKHESADADEDDWADRKISDGIERIDGGGLAGTLGLRDAHGIESGVKNESGEKQAEHGVRTAAEIFPVGNAKDESGEDDDVNQGLVVFAVIDGA